MAVKSFNPTSPARRSMTVLTTENLTKKRPEKSLTAPLPKNGGRNNQGRLTMKNQRRRAQALISHYRLQAS